MSRILTARLVGRIALSALSVSLIVVACQDDPKNDEDDGSGASGNTTSTNVGGNGNGGAGSGATGGGSGTGEMNCTDGLDNDGDTFADCRDYDCCQDPACLTSEDCTDPVENTDALCSNGMDDDEDGLTDCADDSCHGHPDVTVCNEASTPADCENGTDDDEDGFTDCRDKNCYEYCVTNNINQPPIMGTGHEEATTECADGLDNDMDGFIDCNDRSCQDTVESCNEATATTNNCDNGIDDNTTAQGTSGQYMDCDAGSSGGDLQCFWWGYCPDTIRESSTAACSDGDDNDGNTFIDCNDNSCRDSDVQRACDGNPVTCADGIDNDGDGHIDCDDWHCRCCPGSGNGQNNCPFTNALGANVESTCPPCPSN